MGRRQPVEVHGEEPAVPVAHAEMPHDNALRSASSTTPRGSRASSVLAWTTAARECSAGPEAPSSTATRTPYPASIAATVSPAGPAPTTATSTSSGAWLA